MTALGIPRLAWFDDFSPIAFLDEGEPAGWAYSILRPALSAAGLECTMVPTSMGAAQSLLRAGAVDGVACLALDESRLALYDFSRSYLTTGAGFFVLRGADPSDTVLAPARGPVATPAHGPLISHLVTHAPGVGVITTAGYREALDAVISGEAAAAALNVHVGADLAETRYPGVFRLPAACFMSLPIALALAKGRWAAFLERLDGVL